MELSSPGANFLDLSNDNGKQDNELHRKHLIKTNHDTQDGSNIANEEISNEIASEKLTYHKTNSQCTEDQSKHLVTNGVSANYEDDLCDLTTLSIVNKITIQESGSLKVNGSSIFSGARSEIVPKGQNAPENCENMTKTGSAAIESCNASHTDHSRGNGNASNELKYQPGDKHNSDANNTASRNIASRNFHSGTIISGILALV